MATLRECMKFAARLSDAEAGELVDRVDAYIASGIAPADAQRAATQDMVAELDQERAEIVSLAEQATPARPQSAPEQAQAAFSRGDDPPPAADPDPKPGPGFYSDLRKAVAGAKTNASPADYWANLVKGRASPRDLQASGFADWLGRQEGKIRKESVLGWIADNVFVVFRPAQIKSAIGNSGAFDPGNEDIRFSQDDEGDAGQPMLGQNAKHEGFRSAFRRVSLGSASADDVNTVISRPGFGNVYEGPLARNLDSARRLQGELAKAFPRQHYKDPHVDFQRGAIATDMSVVKRLGDADLQTLERLSREYDAPIVARGMEGSDDPAVVNRLRGYGFESYGGMMEVGSRDIKDVGISMVRPAGGMTRLTPLFSQDDEAPSPRRKAAWDSPVESRWDSLVHQVQDKQIDLKRVTQILREGGVTLSDRGDAYLREELWASRAADRVKRFEVNHILPLITEMRASGVDMKTLGTYLHARHAEEANVELQAINRDRPDNEALSGMSTADARRTLAAAAPVMPRLAARVDAMIEATRHLMEVSGLETAETVQALRTAYKHYVPLHRDEAHPDSHTGAGQGFSIPGSVVRRRVGSNAVVTPELILPHVFAAYEMVVSRAEKNLVGQAVYHMALTNPNPDWWTTDAPPTVGVKDERRERFNPGTGQMEGNPNFGQVVFRTDPHYKRADNVLMLRVNGQDRSVQFTETNERAMRMAAALKNLDTLELQFLQKTLGSATRWMAAMNTKYNPVFTIVNALRDLQGAALNLTSTELNGAQAEILGPSRLAGIAREIYRMEQGKPPADPVVAVWVDQFRARGGATGFRQIYSNIEERGNELQARMDRLGRGGAAKAGQEFIDFISAANEAVENMIRVSAFKAALDRGLTPDRAASLAKNLTVNFNRKGAGFGRALSIAFMFFNSAVQGNVRTYQTLTGKFGKTIVVAGLFMGVVQALLTAALLDDDDDENSELLPDYVKRTSWVIPYARDKYLAIPMPLGLHVLPNIGRVLTQTAIGAGRGDGLQIRNATLELTATILDSLSPIGGSDAGLTQMITPSVLKPLVQLAENRGGLGGQIYKDRMPGDAGAPGYTLGRDSTNPAYKALAEAIHRVFHRSPDARDPKMPAWTSPQPEALRLIPESVFGGVWRETEKLLDTARMTIEGKEMDRRRIVLLSRFAGDLSDPSAPTEVYYRALDQVESAHRGALRAQADGRDPTPNSLRGLHARANKVKQASVRLTDAIRELAMEGGHDEEIRSLERERGDMMREWIQIVREVRREPALAQ